jgi:hypothetical protein
MHGSWWAMAMERGKAQRSTKSLPRGGGPRHKWCTRHKPTGNESGGAPAAAPGEKSMNQLMDRMKREDPTRAQLHQAPAARLRIRHIISQSQQQRSRTPQA